MDLLFLKEPGPSFQIHPFFKKGTANSGGCYIRLCKSSKAALGLKSLHHGNESLFVRGRPRKTHPMYLHEKRDEGLSFALVVVVNMRTLGGCVGVVGRHRTRWRLNSNCVSVRQRVKRSHQEEVSAREEERGKESMTLMQNSAGRRGNGLLTGLAQPIK